VGELDHSLVDVPSSWLPADLARIRV